MPATTKHSTTGKPRLRTITPIDPPMIGFAIGGIIAWAVAGLVLLAMRDTLAAHNRTHWLWICLAGFLLGFPGLIVMIRHDANRRRRRATSDSGASNSAASDPA